MKHKIVFLLLLCHIFLSAQNTNEALSKTNSFQTEGMTNTSAEEIVKKEKPFITNYLILNKPFENFDSALSFIESKIDEAKTNESVRKEITNSLVKIYEDYFLSEGEEKAFTLALNYASLYHRLGDYDNMFKQYEKGYSLLFDYLEEKSKRHTLFTLKLTDYISEGTERKVTNEMMRLAERFFTVCVTDSKYISNESVISIKKKIDNIPDNWRLSDVFTYFSGVVSYITEDYSDAYTQFNKIVYQSDFPFLPYYKGMIYLSAGMIRKAFRHLPAIDNPVPEYILLFHKGLNAYEKGEYEEAVEFLLKSQELHPGLLEVYYNLGLAYKGLGNLPKASFFFEKTLEANKNHVAAKYSLGLMMIEIGDYEGAKSILQSVLTAIGSGGEYSEYIERYLLYNNLASLFLESGDTEEARKALDYAVIAKDIYSRTSYASEYPPVKSKKLADKEDEEETENTAFIDPRICFTEAKANLVLSNLDNAYSNIQTALAMLSRVEAIEKEAEMLSIKDDIIVMKNSIEAKIEEAKKEEKTLKDKEEESEND